MNDNAITLAGPNEHLQRGHQEASATVNAIAASVIDAAVEVHRCLGPGFLESVYESALLNELRRRSIFVENQPKIRIFYKGDYVGLAVPDLLVEDQLIVELKAVDTLTNLHKAQLISYLRAAELQLGLIINFRVPILLRGVRRVICSQPKRIVGGHLA